MKNKHGFTLIELLAVIVIVAVVGILTIPVMINNNEATRKKTMELYYNKILSAAKNQYSIDIVKNKKTKDVILYDISELNLDEKSNYQGKVVTSHCNGNYQYKVYLWDDKYEILDQLLENDKLVIHPVKQEDLEQAEKEWSSITSCADFKGFEVMLIYPDNIYETINVYNNQKYEKLPNPVKPGYIFNGWYTSENSGKEVDNNTIFNLNTPDDTPLILYANLKKCPAGSYCEQGNDPKLCNDNTFSSEGAISCTSCPNGYKFQDNDKCAIENYSIKYSYECNGETAKNDSKTYTVESDDIVLNDPTPTGYTFTGWLDKNTNKYLTNSTIPKGTTGDLDLVAQCNVNKYHLHISNESGGISTIYYKTGNQSEYTESTTSVSLYLDYNTSFSFYVIPVKGYTIMSKPGNNSRNPYIGKITIGENKFVPETSFTEIDAKHYSTTSAHISCTEGRTLLNGNCYMNYSEDSGKCIIEGYKNVTKISQTVATCEKEIPIADTCASVCGGNSSCSCSCNANTGVCRYRYTCVKPITIVEPQPIYNCQVIENQYQKYVHDCSYPNNIEMGARYCDTSSSTTTSIYYCPVGYDITYKTSSGVKCSISS